MLAPAPEARCAKGPSLAETTNILTVDVEDWFHILELDAGPTRAEWPALESRVEANTDAVLALLAEAGAKATCFVVGWVAQRHPGLVRRMADAGHEIASHSYWHEVVARHSRDSLAQDLAGSRKLLEDLSGAPVRGFRAPGGSITHATAWALDVVAEAGFSYDSSLNPGISSHGGFATPHLGPHRLLTASGELFEIPSSTVGFGGRRVPFAGGGYLRLFPYRLIDACIGSENRAGRPVNVYVHPREIDPAQPRMAMPWKRRFKYYVGLRSTAAKLRALLRAHEFVSAGAWLDAYGATRATEVFDVRALGARAPADAPFAPPPPLVA